MPAWSLLPDLHQALVCLLQCCHNRPCKVTKPTAVSRSMALAGRGSAEGRGGHPRHSTGHCPGRAERGPACCWAHRRCLLPLMAPAAHCHRSACCCALGHACVCTQKHRSAGWPLQPAATGLPAALHLGMRVSVTRSTAVMGGPFSPLQCRCACCCAVWHACVCHQKHRSAG